MYAYISMARKHITPNCRHAAGGQVSPQSTVCCKHPVFAHAGWLGCLLPVPSLRPLLALPPLQPKVSAWHHPLQGTSWTSALEGLARLTHSTRQPPFYTLLGRKGVRAAAPLLLLIPGPRLRELGKHQQAMLGAVRTLWFSNHITHPVRDQKHGRHWLKVAVH